MKSSFQLPFTHFEHTQTIYAEGTADSYQAWQRFNGLGQLIQAETEGELGPVKVNYQYDTLGRLVQSSVPYLGSSPSLSTTTEYDLLGRTKTVTNPDDTQRSFSYEGWQSLTTIDEAGRETVSQQDAFGRTLEIAQTLEEAAVVTSYQYDTLGNLTDIWDAASHHSQMSYDNLGRLLARSDPDMGFWQYSYDDAGNLKSQTDGNEQVIGFDYDVLGRPIAKDYDDDQSAEESEIRYFYDDTGSGNFGLGRRTRMVDPSGETTWRYDQLGRVLTETKVITESGVFTTGFTYDDLDRVKTMTYPDGEVVTYGYDDSGQVESLTSNLGVTYLSGAQYNALGQPELLSLGAGGVVELDYDYYAGPTHALALQSLVATNQSTQTLFSLSYSDYDDDGSLKTLEGSIGLGGAISLELSYDYNSLGWLEEVIDNGSSPLDLNRSYDYDPVGNLANKNNLTFDYTPENGGLPHAPGLMLDSEDTITRFGYDGNGNRIDLRNEGYHPLFYYEYDRDNRLILARDNSSSSNAASFTYDGDKQQVRRVAYEGEPVSKERITTSIGEYFEITRAWDEEQAIFEEVDNFQSWPHLISNMSGTLSLVWQEQVDGPEFQVRFAQRNPETLLWSTPEIIDSSAASSSSPVVAADPEGNIYVAWHSYYTPTNITSLKVRQRTAAGAWGDSITIDEISTTSELGNPSLVVAPDGSGIYLAWDVKTPSVDETTVYVAQKSAGSWDNIIYQVLITDTSDFAEPMLAVDPQGTVYLAHRDLSGIELLTKASSSSTWQALPQPPNDISYEDTRIVLDEQGNLYIQLRELDYISRWLKATGEWESDENGPVMVSDCYENDDIYGDSFIVDQGGQVSCIWMNPLESVYTNGELGTILLSHLDPSQDHKLVPHLSNRLLAVWSDELVYLAQRRDRITKHYYAAGQRIATRVDDELYYVLGDHLGSTTSVADEQGNEVGYVVYDPFGEVLTSTLPVTLTDRLFTGQQFASTIGLYDYNSRFYDPQVGQFLQPDSLIPQLYNPIALNRYAYVYNSPVNHTDSTGAFIDTLLDLYDLKNNLDNCLGDSDALSCYMVPVSAIFLVLPGLTGSGSARRILYAADGTGIGGASKPLSQYSNVEAFTFANRLTGGGTSTFNPEKLDEILGVLQFEGVEVLRGQEAAEILDLAGAESGYAAFDGRPGMLLFRDNPTISAVVEELIHLGQHRANGWKAFTDEQKLLNEIRAQRYLLDNAERLGLGSDEIEQIRINQDVHFQKYLDYMGW